MVPLKRGRGGVLRIVFSLNAHPTFVDKRLADGFITGRSARSAVMPVLVLLTGPKMGFSPHRGDTLPR